jgi:hypothetical protein
MRKITAIIFMLFSLNATAEDKTALAEAATAIQPALKTYTDYIQKSVMQTMAGNDTPMSEAARKHLRSQARAELEANRGMTRSVRECMKPGNVIDEDVQECSRGLREKSW